MPFDSPTSVSKIERAAKDLYKLLNIKFEDGIQDIKAISDRLKYYSEQHDAFARRLVKFFSDQFNDIVSKQSQRGTAARSPISLPRHDEIYTFLSAYKSLILQSRHQCPREHLEICSQYQSAVGNLISKDFTRLFEALKTAHLLKRPNPEPSSCKIFFITLPIIIILNLPLCFSVCKSNFKIFFCAFLLRQQSLLRSFQQEFQFDASVSDGGPALCKR